MYNTFWLSWVTKCLLPALCFSFSRRRIIYNMTLKIHVANLTSGQGHDLIRKVMLHISRSVSSVWTHACCFYRSSRSLSKVIAENLLVTFRDLKWPWRHDEGSPVTIFRLRVSSLKVFWMIFVQNRFLSFFSHWLIMEMSQNWPARSWISNSEIYVS